MARTIIDLQLSELQIARLRCKKCNMCVEIDLAKFHGNVSITCSGCGQEFARPGANKALEHLGEAYRKLLDEDVLFNVEFQVNVQT